ncbi:MAG TPA: condensation domain-containing protein, partial [Kofleriaceae bacterium]
QVMFAYMSRSESALALEGLRIDHESRLEASKFDLTLVIQEREGAVAGWLEYDSALFDRATVERMAGHYGALLAESIARPDEPSSTVLAAAADVAPPVIPRRPRTAQAGRGSNSRERQEI